jgi:hypothetical protein
MKNKNRHLTIHVVGALTTVLVLFGIVTAQVNQVKTILYGG